MKLNHTQFSHWIKGYQGFYEPIVREWFREHGYADPQSASVSGVDLAAAATVLRSRAVATGLSKWARDRHAEDLEHSASVSRGRLQLDMKAEKDGGLAIGEFKSWAGFYDPPTWNRVEDEFIGQRPGLFLTLRQITGCSVTEWILVLWERSVKHTEIENKLLHRYGVPVRLYCLDEIFSNLGPKARALRDSHLEALEKAVKDVRGFMGT